MLLLGSCADDSEPEPDLIPEVDAYYSLGVVMGEDFSSYLLSTDNLEEGSVSPVGSGVELNSAEFLQSGNYIYFFSRDEKKFYQYELHADGSVTETASLLVTQYITDRAYSQNLVDENTILVMDPVQWGEPEVKWLTISIPDFVVSASGSFNLPTIEKAPGVNWNSNLGRGALHGDKFIMGTVYYDFDGNFADGTHAIVLDYPSMTNPMLIETQLTSAELGIFTSNSFLSTDNGDLYIAAYRGFYGVPTTDDVHGSVLRIKAGENDFDEDYFLDLTQVMGETTQIMQLDFLEGETGMGMLFNDTEIASWDDLDNDHYYFARIDLPNQTVSKFNVPKSDIRLARKPLIEDGKYITYIKSAASNTTNVLEIDYNGDADAYTVGIEIEGDNVQGYSVAKHPTE
ncbi:MAG: hypothetical protein RIG62_09765 [Cyclobacteriaceae bacterium]